MWLYKYILISIEYVVLYTTDKDGNKTSQNFVGTEGDIIGTTRYDNDGFKYYTYNKDV